MQQTIAIIENEARLVDSSFAIGSRATINDVGIGTSSSGCEKGEKKGSYKFPWVCWIYFSINNFFKII